MVKLLDWIDQNITDTRNRDMLLRKLHGETLESIGQVYDGLTRERVRQIISKLLRTFPENLDEDGSDLIYWFTTYNFLKYPQMHNIFGIAETTYYYYELTRSRNTSTTLDDFLSNVHLPKDLYEVAVDQFPKSEQYKELHWHEWALDYYKDVFTNNPHGKLTVLDITRRPNQKGSGNRHTVYFICKCSCGNIVTIAGGSFRRTQSCGCAIKDKCRDLHIGRQRKVRCVETGVIYTSILDATAAVGAAGGNIVRACMNPKYTARGYHWEYVSDSCREAVRCIETGEVFPSISAASKNTPGVYMVLTGRSYTAGGYHWEYVNPDKNIHIRREDLNAGQKTDKN